MEVLHIEEVHHAVELMVGAIDGIKVFDDLMLNQTQSAMAAYDEIIVTAQIVITCQTTHLPCDLILCLDACHPCIYLGILFVVTYLMIVRSLSRQFAWLIRDVAAQQLLISVVRFIIACTVILTSLHTDVHEEEREAERDFGDVIVIP